MIDSTGTSFIVVANDPAGSSGVKEFLADIVTDTPSSQPSESPSSAPSISQLPTSMPSSSPSDTPSKTPSSLPTYLPSALPSVSLEPSVSPDTEFQIRTTYHRFNFDDANWCATPKVLDDNSIIRMRPCVPYNAAGPVNTQVWKRTGGRIQLAYPDEDYCLYKQSMSLFLRLCSNNDDPGFDVFNLDDNEHTLTFTEAITTGPAPTFMVGFDIDRKFSKLFFMKDGNLNPSIYQWKAHYIYGPDDYVSA